jgi:hypothetical protein
VALDKQMSVLEQVSDFLLKPLAFVHQRPLLTRGSPAFDNSHCLVNRQFLKFDLCRLQV